MDSRALELYLYMGSSEQIIDWLVSEGVKTKVQAIDKLRPLVQSNLYSVALSIGSGQGGSLSGTSNCVEMVIKHFI